MQTQSRTQLKNHSIETSLMHMGVFQSMIDRDEFERLLERRVGSLLTTGQFEQLTQRLLELRRPSKRDIKNLCEDVTGCRRLQRSLADFADLIRDCKL
jgi:hypothetical protein